MVGQPPQTRCDAPPGSNRGRPCDASAQLEGVLEQAGREGRTDALTRTDPQVQEGLEAELAQDEGVGLLT